MRALALFPLAAMVASPGFAAAEGPVADSGIGFGPGFGIDTGSVAYWAVCAVVWLAAWALVEALVWKGPQTGPTGAAVAIAIPLVFGVTLLFIWEAIVRGFHVPGVILPPPSAIVRRLASSPRILAADFVQTLKGIAAGYLIGCGSGFVVAVLIDKTPFLKKGLLPVGTLASALPIVGVAPIMVMWFGFDWPSKAAVVAIMTFFPMLVNTNAGLAASSAIERDLMSTYAASYGATLVKLRVPTAMPFVFNGLKINTTLALIGAIVAEFFGTPIVGLGFRINAEVGRMNIDMVWAAITVAALTGTALYATVAVVERRVNFWHPSIRRRER